MLPISISLLIINFKDVSKEYLPVEGLAHNSMDVEAGDIDMDGHLDSVIAMEFKLNVIPINDRKGMFTNESEKQIS